MVYFWLGKLAASGRDSAGGGALAFIRTIPLWTDRTPTSMHPNVPSALRLGVARLSVLARIHPSEYSHPLEAHP